MERIMMNRRRRELVALRTRRRRRSIMPYLSYIYLVIRPNECKRPKSCPVGFCDDHPFIYLQPSAAIDSVKSTVNPTTVAQYKPTIVKVPPPPEDFVICDDVPRAIVVGILSFLGTDFSGHLVVSHRIASSGELVGGITLTDQSKLLSTQMSRNTRRRIKSKPIYYHDDSFKVRPMMRSRAYAGELADWW